MENIDGAEIDHQPVNPVIVIIGRITGKGLSEHRLNKAVEEIRQVEPGRLFVIHPCDSVTLNR